MYVVDEDVCLSVLCVRLVAEGEAEALFGAVATENDLLKKT
jgi:hypothetical protein